MNTAEETEIGLIDYVFNDKEALDKASMLEILQLVKMPKTLDEFNSETSYGEPQHFIPLPNLRNLEIVHEESGLDEKEQYFSWRVHCSEEEFENDKFRGTMGIIDQTTSDTYDAKTIVETLGWANRVAMGVA